MPRSARGPGPSSQRAARTTSSRCRSARASSTARTSRCRPTHWSPRRSATRSRRIATTSSSPLRSASARAVSTRGSPARSRSGTEVLARSLTELVRSARGWARAVVVVSAHGGNAEALGVVATTAARRGRRRRRLRTEAPWRRRARGQDRDVARAGARPRAACGTMRPWSASRHRWASCSGRCATTGSPRCRRVACWGPDRRDRRGGEASSSPRSPPTSADRSTSRSATCDEPRRARDRRRPGHRGGHGRRAGRRRGGTWSRSIAAATSRASATRWRRPPTSTPSSRDTPGAVLGLVGDARSGQDMALAVETAVAQFGAVDAAVASAGVIAGGVAALGDARRRLRRGAVGQPRRGAPPLPAAVPALLGGHEPRHGRLVAVASAAAHVGLRHLAAYWRGQARRRRPRARRRGGPRRHGDHGERGVPRVDADRDARRVRRALRPRAPDEFAEHQPLGRLLEPARARRARRVAVLGGGVGRHRRGLPVDGGMTPPDRRRGRTATRRRARSTPRATARGSSGR